jgi:hypothetical protein
MNWREEKPPRITSALPRFESSRRQRSSSSGRAVLALTLAYAACGGSPTVLTAFRTEQQAQEHCPKDTVVWLNPQTGFFELKGHGSFGLSGVGRSACRGEAERAGMHAVTN